MASTSTVTPGSDPAAYLTSYVEEMAFGDDEPETILDRYHTPDVTWHHDGLRLDRKKLIEHVRPVRRNVTREKITSCHLDIHEALVAGDRMAARYTMTATMRDRAIVTEIYMFGTLAPDGRLRRVDQISRSLPAEATPR
jgi:hypothetical protein